MKSAVLTQVYSDMYPSENLIKNEFILVQTS